jgi:hypothetical protein
MRKPFEKRRWKTGTHSMDLSPIYINIIARSSLCNWVPASCVNFLKKGDEKRELSQWTYHLITKILISTNLDKNFITAWKSITKLVIFRSFVAK